MLSYNELKPGVDIIVNEEPWRVETFEFLRMQQRKPVSKVKVRNLMTGKVQEMTFHQSDELEEAEIERMKSTFLYVNRGEYWFNEANNPKNRFNFKEDVLNNNVNFLKPNIEVVALKFNEKIFNIELPIKMDLEVVEAPPAVKGNTAQGGSKAVITETGASISVPLFINEGDIIRVNTQTGDYVERVEKK